MDFSNPDGSQFHAKAVVIDRKRALIGSANFTWGGMAINHEIGVLLKGKYAWDIASLIDRFASGLSV